MAVISPRQVSRRLSIASPDGLTPAALESWSDVMASTPELDSPFLGPGFAQAMARVRPGVEVAVIESGFEPRGFFAFQRHPLGLGAPLAAYGMLPIARPLGMSDYHGLVAAPGLGVDPLALVRECGLACWTFDHLLVRDDGFAPYRAGVRASPVINTEGGFAAWAATQRRAGSRLLPELARKRRRLEREVGEVRFEAHSTDRAHLDELMRLKRDQYRRTGTSDRLASRWVVDLVRSLHTADAPDLAGRLSVLHVGDRIAAVHLGLRSRRTLHSWLPAYDPALGRHSPGQLLLLEMVRACESEGISRIDLGAGDATYKDRFSTDRLLVADGRVGSLPRPVSVVAHGASSVRTGLARHPVVADPLRRAQRAVRRARSRAS